MRRATTLLALLSLALTTACGAKRVPMPESDNLPSTVRIISPGTETRLTTVAAPTGLADTFEAPVELVWDAMPAVYGALGIDFTTLDQKNRVIGNPELRVRHRLGKVPLSRYVACGGNGSQDNADSYEVKLTITTQLTPAVGQTGTTVATVVQATARSLLFNSGDVSCASTQQLEHRITEVLRERLARS
jgi:hypothetical protein